MTTTEVVWEIGVTRTPVVGSGCAPACTARVENPGRRSVILESCSALIENRAAHADGRGGRRQGGVRIHPGFETLPLCFAALSKESFRILVTYARSCFSLRGRRRWSRR